MTKAELTNYISRGNEIEFTYGGKRYSITYNENDPAHPISFCEFYKETSDVKDVEELARVQHEGVTVLEMLESLTEKEIWIF